MGRGGGKLAIPAALGAIVMGMLGAGCGPESHENAPRPPVTAEVSVSISDSAISAQPGKVGVRGGGAALNQNDVDEPEADPKAPLVVNFTTVNLTSTDTTLEIRGSGGFEKRSGPIVANGNNSFKVGLPNGHYTLEAADLPAEPAPFFVGAARASSQNDLLLP
jgi:hypothetical protein